MGVPTDWGSPGGHASCPGLSLRCLPPAATSVPGAGLAITTIDQLGGYVIALLFVVSPNGWLLGCRGRSFPANASGLDTHCALITSRFDRRGSRSPRRC
eukprot:COSAG01_NODE_5158_length_4445_cov_12.910953_2_plen_99_part_00